MFRLSEVNSSFQTFRVTTSALIKFP